MADIKLKNKQGQEVTFTGVPKLTADKVGGGTQDFIIPSGTKQITANGTYDVTEKASAVVNVPNPSSGTLPITENGTYDVTNYASVEVDVAGSSGPTNYVTFTAQQANSSVKIEIKGTLSPIALYYSTDNTNWQLYTLNTAITLTNIGDYVSFYGVGNWRTTYSTSNYLHFVMTGKIAGSGDCNALLDSGLDAVISFCCYRMFHSCTSLTQAPELPATTLESYCYYQMFFGCTSLTQAPELPATTLESYCYKEMFQGCTSLAQAPELPATTLEEFCYANMFYGCTSLTQAPELPATTLRGYCYSSMFYGCASLVQAPELPATTLASSCYHSIFRDCTSLAQAPELPATTLVSYCYTNMFSGCALITSVKTAVSSWNTTHTTGWLYGVAASGTVYCPANSTIPTGNISGIPAGWTRVDWTPAA